jgi:hypothetical protein
VLKLLDRLFRSGGPSHGASAGPGSGIVNEAPPQRLALAGGPSFDLPAHWTPHEGFPVPDWGAVRGWVEAHPASEHEAAWGLAERAWLLHLRDVLPAGTVLREGPRTWLLSSLEAGPARAMLEFMERTLDRVQRVLPGLAQVPPWGKDTLLVFDDGDTYYRYVAGYYPEAGEYAFSGGMHIDAGCSHYATVKDDLRRVEPVIAHEMTHGCLGHLPLPAWLNEGLAVNVERRLVPLPSSHTPHQLHAMHRAFWGAVEVQEFWCGRSFLRTDEGNLLSYELAQLIVAQLGRDWPRLRAFTLAADAADAGASAAAEHLGVELGPLVCALLEHPADPLWEPDPARWAQPPERGRFSGFNPASTG